MVAREASCIESENKNIIITANFGIFPPRPTNSKGRQVYQQIVTKTMDWISMRLDAAPKTTSPILFTDLNDQLGLALVLGVVEKVESRGIGDACLNQGGFAACQIVQLMNHHRLAALNT